MATNTTNYGFKKPDESDFYDVNDQNNNWDLADEALKELDTPTFEDYTGDTEVPAAETALGNIKSKGKLATLLSNIKAFCKGCCTLAMIVNNCVTDNPNMPLSAAQGKTLMDLYTKLNSDLNNIEKVYPFISADNVFDSLNQIIYKVGNLCIGQIFFQCISPIGEYGTVFEMSISPKEATGCKIFNLSKADKPMSATLQHTGFTTLDAEQSLNINEHYVMYIFFLIN